MREILRAGQKEALEKIEAEIVAGLRHGYFEMKVEGDIISGNKRRLIIRSGKSHKYTIDEEDLK